MNNLLKFLCGFVGLALTLFGGFFLVMEAGVGSIEPVMLGIAVSGLALLVVANKVGPKY
ncbi:hypothetical protein [Azospirillum cavernae]|uniref:hypothetical protein n=1 Tax=Azospirillum cavernae TaxID=2320860 RepID=UPI001313FA38|nr:hypothetical protein [Azospirillum cavernae]